MQKNRDIAAFGLDVKGTGLMGIPKGTTAQREESYNGALLQDGIRLNDQTKELEWNIGGDWFSAGDGMKWGGSLNDVSVTNLKPNHIYILEHTTTTSNVSLAFPSAMAGSRIVILDVGQKFFNPHTNVGRKISFSGISGAPIIGRVMGEASGTITPTVGEALVFTCGDNNKWYLPGALISRGNVYSKGYLDIASSILSTMNHADTTKQPVRGGDNIYNLNTPSNNTVALPPPGVIGSRLIVRTIKTTPNGSVLQVSVPNTNRSTFTIYLGAMGNAFVAFRDTGRAWVIEEMDDNTRFDEAGTVTDLNNIALFYCKTCVLPGTVANTPPGVLDNDSLLYENLSPIFYEKGSNYTIHTFIQKVINRRTAEVWTRTVYSDTDNISSYSWRGDTLATNFLSASGLLTFGAVAGNMSVILGPGVDGSTVLRLGKVANGQKNHAWTPGDELTISKRGEDDVTLDLDAATGAAEVYEKDKLNGPIILGSTGSITLVFYGYRNGTLPQWQVKHRTVFLNHE